MALTQSGCTIRSCVRYKLMPDFPRRLSGDNDKDAAGGDPPHLHPPPPFFIQAAIETGPLRDLSHAFEFDSLLPPFSPGLSFGTVRLNQNKTQYSSVFSNGSTSNFSWQIIAPLTYNIYSLKSTFLASPAVLS